MVFNSPIPVIDGETGEEVFLGVVPPWCLVIDATRRKQLAGGTFGFPCALIVKRFAKGRTPRQSDTQRCPRPPCCAGEDVEP